MQCTDDMIGVYASLIFFFTFELYSVKFFRDPLPRDKEKPKFRFTGINLGPIPKVKPPPLLLLLPTALSRPFESS